MSILDAIRELKRDNSNLQDLALLPQPLIMQMAQRGEIQKELVPLIISKKAEMIDAAARNQALARSGQAPPSVMEQKMMQIAQSENPALEMMPQQMAQMPAPQLPEQVGIAQNPVAPMQMAGGGIIAFANTGLVDDEDEDNDTSYEDYLDEIERSKLESMIMNTYRDSDTGGAGIAYAEPSMPRSEKVGIKTVAKETAAKDKEPDDMVKRLQAQIMTKESGGRRYDKEGKLLTSPKGAEGEMQVMPYTARDPGFGVRPAKDNSPDELRRVGDEYAAAMYKRYGDPKLAMIAYNMGPGATDQWLADGADPRKLPKETQGYIRGVSLAGGGVIAFQGGGTMGGFDDTNYDLDTLRTEEAQKAKKRRELEERYEFLQRTAPDVAAKMTPPPSSETNLTMGYEAKGKQSGATEENIDKFLKDRAEVSATPVAAPPQTEAAMSAQDKLFAQMQDAFSKREARLAQSRELDPYLALMSAGLGIAGGTSPYALTNIGQGGAQGVAQYAALQKGRAAEEAGLGTLQNKMLTTAMTGELRKDLQSQASSAKYANALSNVREERLKQIGEYLKKPEYMDLGMLQTYAQRLAKNPADKEAKTKYESLITKKQALENKIRKELPDPDPSLFGVKGASGNVIKLD